MFIAHLPAGYLLSQVHPTLKARSRWIMAGSILPDLDLFVAYFLHSGTVHHHSYLSHRPFFWLCLIALGLLLRRFEGGRCLAALGAGGVLHVLLDTVAGAIAWGWPLSDVAHPWVVVPATYDWWVLSFLTHWSFGIEALICGFALIVWTTRKCKSPGTKAGA